jgi:hypothetical protein
VYNAKRPADIVHCQLCGKVVETGNWTAVRFHECKHRFYCCWQCAESPDGVCPKCVPKGELDSDADTVAEPTPLAKDSAGNALGSSESAE